MKKLTASKVHRNERLATPPLFFPSFSLPDPFNSEHTYTHSCSTLLVYPGGWPADVDPVGYVFILTLAVLSLTSLDIPKPLEFVLDSGVNSVTFSPDGSYLVIGCNDGTIQQWRISDGKKTTMKADGSVLVVAVSSDGKWIVSGGLDCKVTVWDAKTQKSTVEATQMNEKWISALDVSPGSTRFVSASSDYTANIWSLTTGQRLVGPLKHNNRVDSVAFSPDGDQVATAGLYDCLRVWDSRDGHLITEVSSLFPESLVWWRDDQILASTQSTQQWIDALSGSILLELPRNDDTATKAYLAVSRNRNFLASLEKRTLCLWDQTSCSWSRITSGLGYAGHTIAISPDNRHLVTGGEDKISIWNLPHFAPENATHVGTSFPDSFED